MASVTTALVTGSAGFFGKNLIQALGESGVVSVRSYDIGDSSSELDAYLSEVDVVFHLAGVNRPDRPDDFEVGNHEFTRDLCRRLSALGRAPMIVFASSIQAALDNAYGSSKRRAEEALRSFSEESGAVVVVFRLKNLFGKWCRPNYNSVVATFCHNIARDLAITISDPSKRLELVYIDDAVEAFVSLLADGERVGFGFAEVTESYELTLGALAERIRAFRASRASLLVPDLSDRLTRCLYATYLASLDASDFAYSLTERADPRGSLAEFAKSPSFGQIFVSRTMPGVTRGNHFHHTKTEKFLVLEGEAVVRFRHILGGAVIAYPVSGRDFRVIDIPPGYTHSIQNVGATEMAVLFWASEPFDPRRPDTRALEVLP